MFIDIQYLHRDEYGYTLYKGTDLYISIYTHRQIKFIDLKNSAKGPSKSEHVYIQAYTYK